MDFTVVCLITMSAIITLQLYHKIVPQLRHKMCAVLPCLRRQTRSATTRVPRIYTRTGDNGTSALFSGERRSKDDNVFEALGTTDELSSMIGMAREFVNNDDIKKELETIQCILQDLQSAIATPRKSAKQSHINKTKWDINHLLDLEQWIDNHSLNLPPLSNFILPVCHT